MASSSAEAIVRGGAVESRPRRIAAILQIRRHGSLAAHYPPMRITPSCPIRSAEVRTLAKQKRINAGAEARNGEFRFTFHIEEEGPKFVPPRPETTSRQLGEYRH